MQSTAERRSRILETLSVRRYETRERLAMEFGVSKRTIERDVELLSCSAPIYTVQGNGGGIYVTEGWYASRRYLTPEQEALLTGLLDGLEPDKQLVMQGILDIFAVPKRKS